MFLKATNSFFAFQKKLYLKCLDEVNRLIGKKRKYLTQYEVEFDESISHGSKEVDFDSILKAIEASKIVLFGDFHTLPNSQALLIQTVQKYRDFDCKSPIVIALECFSTHDKKHIEDYLLGELTEKDFLLKTGYHTGWGFPWAHYRRIFCYAKEIGAKIIPINNPLYTVNIRDQKISDTLVREIIKSDGKAKIFCLIGEFHLAERHLPVELKHRLPNLSMKHSIVKILVNVDSHFFNHNLSSVPERETVLQLGEAYFCILDTPPWIKWLTYRLWQDQDNHENLECLTSHFISKSEYCFLDLENDDVEYKIVQHAQFLAKFFSVHSQLDEFYSYHFIRYDKNDLSEYNLNSFEMTLLEKSIEQSDAYVCKKNRVVFYNKLTLRILISCAGQILFLLKTGRRKENVDYGFFICREILKGIFSSFSQIVFNPYVFSNKEKHMADENKLQIEIKTILDNNHMKKRDQLREIISFLQERISFDSTFYSGFNELVARRLFSIFIQKQSDSNCLVKDNFLRDDSNFTFEEGLINVLHRVFAE